MRFPQTLLLIAVVCVLYCARFTHARVFNPIDYNARGDGSTDDTHAIRTTLAAAAANGGGEVLFDTQYTFLTGCFNVTSNIILNIKGKILASLNSNDYVVIEPLPWLGSGLDGLHERQALVHSYNSTNITITGGGVIDGQGAPWWACSLAGSSGPPCNGLSRPNLILLVYTNDIRIHDITFKDSPSWTTHIAYCTNVYVNNTRVLAPEDSHNTDGFDIDCSENVLIENSYYSGGDDAIAIQNGVNKQGREYGRATRNVTVRKMTIGTSHGISVGSETAAGVSNVLFQDIAMNGSMTGVRIKSQRGRGGLVQNITYTNIRLKNVHIAIQMTHNYSPNLEPENEIATPILKNVHVNGVVCDGAKYGWWLDGLPESLIYDVSFSNIHFTNIVQLVELCHYIVGFCDSGSVSPSCPLCLK